MGVGSGVVWAAPIIRKAWVKHGGRTHGTPIICKAWTSDILATPNNDIIKKERKKKVERGSDSASDVLRGGMLNVYFAILLLFALVLLI